MVTGPEWLERPGTVGRPVFGEMRVVGESGETAKPGEVGEIYLRPAEGTLLPFDYIGAETKVQPIALYSRS
jgi:bile acid-coenzyme A ligase